MKELGMKDEQAVRHLIQTYNGWHGEQQRSHLPQKTKDLLDQYLGSKRGVESRAKIFFYPANEKVAESSGVGHPSPLDSSEKPDVSKPPIYDEGSTQVTQTVHKATVIEWGIIEERRIPGDPNKNPTEETSPEPSSERPPIRPRPPEPMKEPEVPESEPEVPESEPEVPEVPEVPEPIVYPPGPEPEPEPEPEDDDEIFPPPPEVFISSPQQSREMQPMKRNRYKQGKRLIDDTPINEQVAKNTGRGTVDLTEDEEAQPLGIRQPGPKIRKPQGGERSQTSKQTSQEKKLARKQVDKQKGK